MSKKFISKLRLNAAFSRFMIDNFVTAFKILITDTVYWVLS